jgi:hypothetical protein
MCERLCSCSDEVKRLLGRETQLLHANNAELEKRRKIESEANQHYCDTLLLRAECIRLRELNGILSSHIEASHGNSGEALPKDLAEAIDAVFPPQVAAIVEGCTRVHNLDSNSWGLRRSRNAWRGVAIFGLLCFAWTTFELFRIGVRP